MIRKATIEDLDNIYEIAISSFENPWEKVSIEAEFYKDYSYIHVNEIDNKVIGYIISWLLGNEAELLTIAIHNDYRRKGIGTEFLKYVMDLYGNDVLWHLEVACSNKGAIQLYKIYGFEINSIIADYYGVGKDAYRMVLSPNSNIK